MRIVRTILWGLFVVAMLGIGIAALFAPRRQHAFAPLFAAPDLTLIDQDGRAFSTASLHGHPWIADFIFTSCAGECPIMSHKMAELQNKTPPSVSMASFTVDPAHDTPVVLKQYGQELHADFSRWHFLTGTQQEMSDAAVAMKIAVQPASGPVALSHSNRFLLVDGDGKVVGIYDGTSADAVKRLAADATQLAKESSR